MPGDGVHVAEAQRTTESKPAEAQRRRPRPAQAAGPAALAPRQIAPGTGQRSLIGLRSVVGNHSMTRILSRQAAGPARVTQGRSNGHGFAGATAAPVSHESVGSACIQRHSAYEHYLLGQVAPAKLAEIPQVREIPSLQKQLADL